MQVVIGPEEFAALMANLGPWPIDRRVAVAVSGGADSLCLAWLAVAWGRASAIIVDHALRPDSAEEAALAARRLEAFRAPAHIVRLTDLPPGPGIAARARAARYAALIRTARALGLSDILLAHHARDQAETVLMRRQAGSGEDGLAGMAPITELPGARLVRPLLAVSPGDLRACLHANGLAWSEDPSNQDRRALRTRLRQALDDPAGDGPATARLVAQARQAAARRLAADTQRAEDLARRACLFPEGYALLSPGPIAAGSLAALIRALSGGAYPPPAGSVESLAARSAAGPLAGTLGGVRFLPAGRLGPGTLVVREAASMAPPIAARDGAIWDSRFRLAAPDGVPSGAEIGALGDAARLFRARSDLPSVILRALPALRVGQVVLAVPHLGVETPPDYTGPPLFKLWTNQHIRLTFEPATPVAGAPFGPVGRGDAQSGPRPYLDSHDAVRGNPGASAAPDDEGMQPARLPGTGM